MKIGAKIAGLGIVASIWLSGCSATELFTETSFVEPNAEGEITRNLGAEAQGYTKIDADGNGYAFKVGYTSSDLVAVAGVIPGTHPGPKILSGKATYYGTWVLGGYQNVRFKGASLDQTPMADAGTITLNADFDAATLTGTGVGISEAEAKELFGDDFNTANLGKGVLVVNGTIDKKQIGGSVTYKGVSGDLDGDIGGRLAVGAYHGKGNKTVFAGGFYAGTDIDDVVTTFCASNDCTSGLPEGFELPEGYELPEGLTLPEGVVLP